MQEMIVVSKYHLKKKNVSNGTFWNSIYFDVQNKVFSPFFVSAKV